MNKYEEALNYFVALCTLNFDKEGAKNVSILKEAVSKAEELEKYKDIEEELGIDIELLVKALKNGVYTKNGFEYPTLVISFDIENTLGFNFLIKGGAIYFKDYGKTWRLVKEDLKR